MDVEIIVKQKLLRSAAALAVSGIALSAGAAGAQEEQESSLRTTVDTIVVEATRRAQDQQTVPIAMTAITGEQLERKFAQDLRDLTNAAPNIQLEPVGIFQASPSFYIRGQGSGDIESASDPKVNIFVDGVVMARVSTSLSDFLDVETVEILRGPQGTTFGRNTVAGAVLVRHNAPDMEEFSISGGFQLGNFGRRDIKGTVNVPIIKDKVAARVAFKSSNFNGYWTNSVDGEPAGGLDHLTILPSIKFTPNDNLDITLRGEYVRARDDVAPSQIHNACRDDPFTLFTGGGGGPGGSPDNNLIILMHTLFNLSIGQDVFTASAGAATTCGKDIRKVSVAEEYTTTMIYARGNKKDFDVWGITGEINYDIPDVGTLTYIGNYRKVDEDMNFDIGLAAFEFLDGNRIQAHDQTSHELRFASEFSDRVDFVAGAYYFEQEYTMKQESFGILFGPNMALGPFNPGTFNLSNSFTSANRQSQAGFSNQTNDAWAVFIDGNIHITDKLTFIAGARYTKESKGFLHCGVGAGNADAPFSDGVAGCNNVPWTQADLGAPLILGDNTHIVDRFASKPVIGFDLNNGAEGECLPVEDPSGAPVTCNNLLHGDASWSKFTPRAGISYQVNDDMMAFVTWSRGWRSGGFNARATTPQSVGPFDPETTTSFEVGIKTEWFENRLRMNLNAFHSKATGSQFSFIRASEGSGGQETITENIGSETFKGVELEWSAVPTDSLSLFGSFGFLHVEQAGFCVDGDGPAGKDDPVNPPVLPGPASQLLEKCDEETKLTDAVGNFIGWNQPTDASNISQASRAPKWTISAGFAYEWLIGNAGSLTASADWLFASSSGTTGTRASEADKFATDPEGAGVRQYNGDFLSHKRSSSHIINAQVMWRDMDDRYKVSFFVKNLTNELMLQYVVPVGISDIRIPNLRRHWGIEVSFNL